jgi:Zn-finger protein
MNIDTGGNFIITKNGFKLWNCSDCRYIHQDYVVKELDVDINESDPFIKLNAWIKLLRIMDVKTIKE